MIYEKTSRQNLSVHRALTCNLLAISLCSGRQDITSRPGSYTVLWPFVPLSLRGEEVEKRCPCAVIRRG